jgi:hypothetical protein
MLCYASSSLFSRPRRAGTHATSPSPNQHTDNSINQEFANSQNNNPATDARLVQEYIVLHGLAGCMYNRFHSVSGIFIQGYYLL